MLDMSFADCAPATCAVLVPASSAISVPQASKARRMVSCAAKDEEDTIAAIEDMVVRACSSDH